MLGWLGRMWRPRDEALPLYRAVVARAREPHWYLDGAAPDTVDGRFDMVAAVLSLVLLRLEREPAGAEPAARLTERFVDDMDGQLREIGVGDIVVGKHIGRMMAMLGGRLGALRDGVAGRDLKPALVRNLFRGTAPAPEALAYLNQGLLALYDRLGQASVADLIQGHLP